MEHFVILATKFKNGYWRTSQRAPFTNVYDTEKVDLINNYEVLNKICPVWGIGYYKNSPNMDKCNNKEFIDFIQIKSIEKVGEKDFYINTIHKSKTRIPSSEFEDNLPKGYRYLFNIIDKEIAEEIVKKLRIKYPDKGRILEPKLPSEIEIELNSAKVVEPFEQNHWKSFIGSHFLEVLKSDYANDTRFEDVIYDLFAALDFTVKQKGHKIQGHYPDGIAFLDDIIIVYDCKNTSNYYPVIEDINKLKSYVKNAESDYKSSKVFPLFIAREFSIKGHEYGNYITVESLMYLYYKKIIMGSNFNLLKIKKALTDSHKIDMKWINNEFDE